MVDFVSSDGSPLVSIIIPCWNAEKYVGEAIESALAQTYPNIEVIVIDDGSTDRSLHVIKSFGDQIRWETGQNQGACAARNWGLALARGEYIQFLDADDLLYPCKLERQLPLTIQASRDIIFCDFECLLIGSGSGAIQRVPVSHTDSVILALTRAISTPAPIYPRDVLIEIGGWDHTLSCAQDYDLNLRLACQGVNFLYLPELLITARRLPGSVSTDYIRVLDNFGSICWRAYRDLQNKNSLTDKRAEAFAVVMANQARTYLRYGEKDKALSRFSDAAKMHSSGGLTGAYQPCARVLRRLVGPVVTEKLVQVKRRVIHNRSGRK